MNTRHPLFLLTRAIVRTSALLVPWWWRRGFVQEWDAELHCAWTRNEERGGAWAGRFRLLRRSLFSVGDALTISTRGWRLEGIGRDLRIAVRTLIRKPAFSLVAILTLALGIGANTAVYSLVDGVLLEPLPYPESDELVMVYMTAPGIQLPMLPLSAHDYAAFRRDVRAFEELAIYTGGTLNLTGGDQPERLLAARATFAFFDVVGVRPAIGRTFVEGDDAPGATAITVLSDGLWRRSFGADPNILGRTISLDGVATEVVGVMPPGFDMPRATAEVWIPLTVDAANPDIDDHSFAGLARLRDGVTIDAAYAEMERAVRKLSEDQPDQYPAAFMEQAQVGPVVRTRKEHVVGDIQESLWVLLGVVGFVLLIACANVANLFLVRAEGRTREVAVRTSLGASPGDVVRYYLTEALVLAGLGGVLGAILGKAAVSGVALLAPVALPRLDEVGLDGSVLAFTAAVSLVAAVLFGLFPAMRYAAPSLVDNLKEGSRGATAGRGGKRARSALVVVQVALALVLLVGSGLMARSFWSLRAVDPGFVAEGVLTMDMALPLAAYPTDQTAVTFYEDLISRVEGLPGVVSAAVVNNVPLGGGRTGSDMGVEDFPPDDNTLPRVVEQLAASPGYLETMGIRLKEGRWLTQVDGANRTGNVVIGEQFANRYWPDGGALGKRINTSSDFEGEWLTIVGVMEHLRQTSLTEDALDLVYTPLLTPEGAFDPPNNASVVVKTDLDPTSLTRPVQEVIWSLDPNLPIANPRAMTEVLRDSMSATSFTMVMLGVASIVALLLGAIGIYGVISYMVSQRIREIGVRMALGAPRATVLRMVARQGLVLAGIGLVVGLIGAVGMSTVLESLLIGVNARDVLTYGAVTLLLGLTAALASILPARRAVRIDPVEALRTE